jgi:hypothetical protein
MRGSYQPVGLVQTANARIFNANLMRSRQGDLKHSNDGSGWKDTTQDSIERVEENIRELSKLIYKYEAARFER